MAVSALNLPLRFVVSPPDPPSAVNQKIKAHQYLLAALHKWGNSKKCGKKGLVIHKQEKLDA